jgi:hypothetical protein
VLATSGQLNWQRWRKCLTTTATTFSVTDELYIPNYASANNKSSLLILLTENNAN